MIPGAATDLPRRVRCAAGQAVSFFAPCVSPMRLAMAARDPHEMQAEARAMMERIDGRLGALEAVGAAE